MQRQYIEQRDTGYWITGTRISLDSVVYGFLRGESPESIQESFQLLTLEEVYGAIAFYLGHQAEINAYLKDWSQKFEEARQVSREANPLLYRKLEAARTQTRAS